MSSSSPPLHPAAPLQSTAHCPAPPPTGPPWFPVTAHILWAWINPKKLGLRRRKGDAKRKGKKIEYRKVKLSQIWSNFDHIWKVWMLNSLKSIKQQIWTDDTHNSKGGIRIFVKQRLNLRSYMRRQNGYLGIFINLSCEMLLSQSTLGQHGNTVQSMY